jgi:hypothetical protein
LVAEVRQIAHFLALSSCHCNVVPFELSFLEREFCEPLPRQRQGFRCAANRGSAYPL